MLRLVIGTILTVVMIKGPTSTDTRETMYTTTFLAGKSTYDMVLMDRQVQRDFKKWVKESGIESNLSPHALRHTVGTRLLKEFKNAKLVQRYLGHSDVATTLRYYVDVFPEDLEEAVEALTQK